MKAVWGVISVVLATVISGILLGLFQTPIQEHFTKKGIQADIFVGPWQELPNKFGKFDGRYPIGYGNEYFIKQVNGGENFPFAKMELSNPTSHQVTDLAIRFPHAEPFFLLVINNDGTSSFYKEEDIIHMGALKPGEFKNVYIWTIYDLSNNMMWDRIKSYSSEGRFIYKVHGYDVFDYDFPFFRALDKYGINIIAIAAILIMFVLYIIVLVHMEYVKQLLNDIDFYDKEQKRWAVDPKKFSIRLKST